MYHDDESASHRNLCEESGKVEYSSKHDALKALTGQLRSKRIRVYPCPFNRSHFHISKEKNTDLGRNSRRIKTL